MKLEGLQSYKKDSQNSRIVVLVCVIASIGASVFMYIDSRNFIANQSAKKVVIDRENHAWLATEQDFTREDRKIQYEEHVKDFYRLFFAFDGGTFDTNVNRGLNLMEGDLGKSIYIKEYVEKNIAREVVENNWQLRVEIVKVECDISKSPAQGVIYARQTLVRPAGEVVRNMNATFTVADVKVSYDNPRGALIMGFDIFDNSRVIKESKK
ncbi:MAG: hypothetical protein WAU36_04240 [Cyclobacteriaceae bacterium]